MKIYCSRSSNEFEKLASKNMWVKGEATTASKYPRFSCWLKIISVADNRCKFNIISPFAMYNDNIIECQIDNNFQMSKSDTTYGTRKFIYMIKWPEEYITEGEMNSIKAQDDWCDILFPEYAVGDEE